MPQEPTQEMVFLPEDHLLNRKLFEFLQSPELAETVEVAQLRDCLVELFTDQDANAETLQLSLNQLQQLCERPQLRAQQALTEPLERVVESLRARQHRPQAPQIGPYEVLKTLGVGGQGVVYLARHAQTQQLYALKTLLQHSDREQHESFTDEAVMAAKLNDPHCVKVHALERDPRTGLPLIVSEYVPGLNAREMLESESMQRFYRECGLKPAVALAFFRPMLAAVRHAHELGIIHQDIKPENFLVSAAVLKDIQAAIEDAESLTGDELDFLIDLDSAWIKLSDWGLALLKRRENMRMSLQRTVTIASLDSRKRGGTLIYMCMEQIDGQGISRKVDVYALGLVFYELLTGQTAFEARKQAEGLTELAISRPESFLVQVASSKARSSIDIHGDPALQPFASYPRLLALLQGMTMKQKKPRWTTLKVQDEVQSMTVSGDFGERRRLAKWSAASLLLLLAIAALLLGSLGPWQASGVKLDDLTQLNMASLESLNLGQRQRLVLPSLTQIDEPCLNYIVQQFRGKLLSLPRLKRLSPEQLKALRGFRGQRLLLAGYDPPSSEALRDLAAIRCEHISVRRIKVQGQLLAFLCATAKSPIDSRMTRSKATRIQELRRQHQESKAKLQAALSSIEGQTSPTLGLDGVTVLSAELIEDLRRRLPAGATVDVSGLQLTDPKTASDLCQLPMDHLRIAPLSFDEQPLWLTALDFYRGSKLSVVRLGHLSDSFITKFLEMNLAELSLEDCVLTQSTLKKMAGFQGLLDISKSDCGSDLLCRLIESKDPPKRLALRVQGSWTKPLRHRFFSSLLKSPLQRLRLFGLDSKNFGEVFPLNTRTLDLAPGFRAQLELPDLKTVPADMSKLLPLLGARALRFRNDVKVPSPDYEFFEALAAFCGWVEPARLEKQRQSVEYWRAMSVMPLPLVNSTVTVKHQVPLSSEVLKTLKDSRNLKLYKAENLRAEDFMSLLSKTPSAQLLNFSYSQQAPIYHLRALSQFQGRMITLHHFGQVRASDFETLKAFRGILVMSDLFTKDPSIFRALSKLQCECLAFIYNGHIELDHTQQFTELSHFTGPSAAFSLRRFSLQTAKDIARIKVQETLWVDDEPAFLDDDMTKQSLDHPEILSEIAKTKAKRLILGSRFIIDAAQAKALLNFKGSVIEARRCTLASPAVRTILDSVPGRRVLTK